MAAGATSDSDRTRSGDTARRLAALWLAVASLVPGACTDTLASDAPTALTELQRSRLLGMSPLPPLPASPSNAWADDEAAARLGQRIFFDKGMSIDGKVACATCHDPQKAFADGRPRARGVADVPRHTPTALLAAWQPWQFWDGRADSLWAQALGPLESPEEHGFDRVAVAHRLRATLATDWQAVFGALPDLADGARFPAHARPDADAASPLAKAWAAMTPADRAAIDAVFVRVGKALEAYQRRLRPTEIALDRYVAALRQGDDSGGGALSPAAKRGLSIFLGAGRCVFCHVGPRLSNGAFHNIGLDQPSGAPAIDRGRYDGASQVAASAFNCLGPHSDAGGPAACGELPFLQQKEVTALGAFKTPSLRSVALTAPYMHAGQYATLADVIDHYDHADDHLAPIGPRESFVTSLGLSAGQRADLRALLETFDAHAVDDDWSRPTP